MIKYEKEETEYSYDKSKVDKIIEMLNEGNFRQFEDCTQEKVSSLLDTINDFISSFIPQKRVVEDERHETEDEARAYFGEEFIKKFDALLTMLDRQKSILAIHGTFPFHLQSICDNGLQYKFPSLSATAVQQRMNYGDGDMHYEHYEGLLNWQHHQHKGLVLIDIPYECFYKEGLWEHYQETNSGYGQDYRINPDFIVGYIDVEKKEIVLNPKYKRDHDYSNLEHDSEIYHPEEDMDNEKLQRLMAEDRKKEDDLELPKQAKSQYVPDPKMIPYILEHFLGYFATLKNNQTDTLDEERYKWFLEQLHNIIDDIKTVLPSLLTDEQVKEKQASFVSVFDNPSGPTF